MQYAPIVSRPGFAVCYCDPASSIPFASSELRSLASEVSEALTPGNPENLRYWRARAERLNQALFRVLDAVDSGAPASDERVVHARKLAGIE